MIIVKCEDVRKAFKKREGLVRAVDGVSLEIEKGETFGLVGESGCGKTTLGKIILGILKPDSGLVKLTTKEPQVIFQDPSNSLDPKMRVYDIIAEGLRLQKKSMVYSQWSMVQRKIGEVLDLVRLPNDSLKKYPHQFSGGERQRIAIARAVITQPEFIVCDEPVSSLDVTIQLQILKLLKNIQQKFTITYLFISHDLRVIKFMSDRVAVMKDGRIVEEGPVQQVYNQPKHQYTKLLLSSILTI